MAAALRPMPSFAKPTPELAALFDATLPDDPSVVRKKVFGSPSAVLNGNMFAGVRGTRIAVRLPEPALAEALALAGAERYEPIPGRPMQGFALLPETLHADPEALRGWIARAFDGALAMPAKQPKTRKPKATKR